MPLLLCLKSPYFHCRLCSVPPGPFGEGMGSAGSWSQVHNGFCFTLLAGFPLLSFILSAPAWDGSSVGFIPSEVSLPGVGCPQAVVPQSLPTLASLACGLKSPMNNPFWHGDLPSKRASGRVFTTAPSAAHLQLSPQPRASSHLSP